MKKTQLTALLSVSCMAIVLLCSSRCRPAAAENSVSTPQGDSGFVATGWRYTAFVDSTVTHVKMYNQSSGIDSFVYDPKEKAIYTRFWYLKATPPICRGDTMYATPIDASDSSYIRRSIFDFELKGIFTSPEAFPWSFMYYIHPGTKDVLRLSYKWYPGYIDGITFFLHDSINPIAGRMEEARRYFKPAIDRKRLQKALTDTAEDGISTVTIIPASDSAISQTID